MHENVDSSLYYTDIALHMADSLEIPEYRMFAFKSYQMVYYWDANYPASLDFGFKAWVIADSIIQTSTQKKYLTSTLAEISRTIGSVYSMTLNATKADEYYQNALNKFKLINDTTNIILTLTNIGDNHAENAMYNEAYQSYQEALGYCRLSKKKEYLSATLLGHGVTAFEQYKSKKILNTDDYLLPIAKMYLLEAYNAAKDNNDDFDVINSASHLSLVMLRETEKNNYSNERRTEVLDSCRNILLHDYRLIKDIGLFTYHIEADLAWADYLVVSRQYKKAQHFIDSLCVRYNDDIDLYGERLGTLYDTYTSLNIATGKKDDALRTSELARYWQLEKRSNTYATTVTQSIAQARFDEEMKQRQIEATEREVRLESQKRLQRFFLLAAAIVLILIGRSHYRSHQHNKELRSKNNEIAGQNKIIQNANREITDSINYASNIQQAVMPTEEQLGAIFDDYMLLFKPLNIVSGDYYWATQIGNLKLVVAADSTGHGVPGAFVSMLGISILNDIANHIDTTRPNAAEVLNELRAIFKKLLKQNGNEEDNHDGMDLALLIIDLNAKVIHFAGAFRPLIFIHNGQLTKVDADRMPIGSHLLDQHPFTDHVIPYTKGDLCYIFSDGVTDQFGYDPNGNIKKFTARRFNSLLTDICQLPFNLQKQRIEEALTSWRNDNGKQNLYEQTDDNIVFGIRLSN